MADGTRDDNGTGMPTQRLSESDWAGRVLLADTGRYSSQGGLQTGRSAITDAYNRTSASGFTPRPEQPIPDPKSMAGAPTSKDEQKPPTTKAVGSTGTQIFGGIIAQTQEYNEDFYWRAAIDVYEQMRRTDAQVAAILTMLYLPIERADWDITPASDDPADVELASFVKSALFDDLVYVTTEGRTVRQAWQSIVQQVLTMLPFGFSVFAKWWRIDDEGYVKLARLEPILQRTLWRWWPGADNQLVGVQQRGFRNWQIVYEDIHADALLLFVNRQEGSNYDGWSVLRAAYKHWYYLDVFYRLQGIGIEKHTFMPPIGILGPLANSTEDANALFEQIKNIRTADSNGIVTPHGSSIEFPKGIQRGQSQDIEFAIHHHDDKIARAVLASFVSMGSNETGTFALADVLVRTFYDTLQGTLEYICGVFNAELIPQLVNYNFRNVQIYPKLTGGSVRHIDMADITALLPYLNDDPQLEDWLRKLAGAPMAPKSAVNTTNPSGSQPGADGQRPQGNDLSGGGKNGGQNAGAGGQNDAGDGNAATGEGADGGADGDGGGGGSTLSEVALLSDALESLGLIDAVERAEAHGAHGPHGPPYGRTLLSNPYPRGPHGHYGEGGEHGEHQSQVGKGLKGSRGGKAGGGAAHNPEHATGEHAGEKVGAKSGGGSRSRGGKSGGGGSKAAKAGEEAGGAKRGGGRTPHERAAAKIEAQAEKARAEHGGSAYRALVKNGSVDVRGPDGTRFTVRSRKELGLTVYDAIPHGETTAAHGHNGIFQSREDLANWMHGTTVVRASAKAGGGAKAEKAPAEGIHERAARLQREGGLREEAKPGSKNPVLNHMEGAKINPYSDRPGAGLGAPGLAKMYGEHALGAQLHGYGREKLNAEAGHLGVKPGRTNAETISRITSHVTEGRYSANFGGEKAAGGAKGGKSEHEAMRLEVERLRAENAQLKAGAGTAKATRAPREAKAKTRTELTPIAHVGAREANPGAAPNAHYLRALYGDHQLHAALNRYGTGDLKQAAQLVGAKAGRSREEAIQRIIQQVTRVPYEETLRHVQGEAIP